MVNYGKGKKLQNNNINCTTIVRAKAAQNKKNRLYGMRQMFSRPTRKHKKNSVQQHIVAVGMWLLVGNNMSNRHKYVFHKCPLKIFPYFLWHFLSLTAHRIQQRIRCDPFELIYEQINICSFILFFFGQNYLKSCLFQYKYANEHKYCKGMNRTCTFSVIWRYHCVQWATN